MKIEVRLCPTADGPEVWTESAVRSLIGQSPDYQGTPTEILDARIRDGWVVVVMDVPEIMPDYREEWRP